MVDPLVAIYWDFENIHASVLQSENGPDALRELAWKPQEAVVDVESIVAFSAGIGRVVINRAYANWQWLWKYRDVFHETAMDLVQLFPLGRSGKNGADVRMAIDVVDDLARYDCLTHVVLVTGDSDFVGLAQSVRRRGCSVIGVGVEEHTSRKWAAACDQFVYYGSVAPKAAGRPGGKSDGSAGLEQHKHLVVRSIRHLARRSPVSPWVVKAAIKPMMQRLDSTFDEASSGFLSIGDLLDACGDVVLTRQGQHDHEYRIVDDVDSEAPLEVEHPYERILRRSGWRLVDRPILWAVLDAIGRAADGGRVADLPSLDAQATRLLVDDGVEVDLLDVKKVRQIAYRCRAIARRPEDGAIELLVPKVLLHRAVIAGAATRICDQSVDDHLDTEALAGVLFGAPTADQLALVAECVADIGPARPAALVANPSAGQGALPPT